MYYHCRDLKFVEYGKVYPHAEDDSWDDMYKWLGHYCGYCPQIWLARGRSSITGFRSRNYFTKMTKQTDEDGFNKSKTCFYKSNDILFGFENIQGFPLRYGIWELLMNIVGNEKDFKKQNLAIAKSLNEYVQWCEEEKEPLDDELTAWVASGCNVEKFLKDYVFVKVDQVVVPALNLKSAKKIICRNEKHKKSLRKMGFIEDRIKIMNVKRWTW